MYSDPRILGLYFCNLLSVLCLVLCCDIYRSTLISIMYPACMITVHDRKSRALHIDIARRTSSQSTWRDGHAHRYIVSDEQSDEGEDLPSETERRSLQMHEIMKKPWNDTDITTVVTARKTIFLQCRNNTYIIRCKKSGV